MEKELEMEDELPENIPVSTRVKRKYCKTAARWFIRSKRLVARKDDYSKFHPRPVKSHALKIQYFYVGASELRIGENGNKINYPSTTQSHETSSKLESITSVSKGIFSKNDEKAA